MSGELNLLYVPMVSDGNSPSSGTLAVVNETIADSILSLPVQKDTGNHFALDAEVANDADVHGTPEQVRETLSSLANSYNADIVVSGSVRKLDRHLVVAFSIFVASDPSGEISTTTGLQPATPVEISDGGVDPVDRRILRQTVMAASQRTLDLVGAIALYVHGEYRDAIQDLDRIIGRSTALHSSVVESAAYLYIGNSLGRLGNSSGAQSAYASALISDASNVRASLGLAELDYQKSRGNCTQESIRASQLEANILLYERLSRSAPTIGFVNADAEARGLFGKSRAELCLGLGLHRGDLLDRAYAGFGRVSDVLRAGNYWRLPSLVAEAMASQSLARINRADRTPTRTDIDEAIQGYISAARVTKLIPRKALFLTTAAQLYDQVEDRTAADACYVEARGLESPTGREPGDRSDREPSSSDMSCV